MFKALLKAVLEALFEALLKALFDASFEALFLISKSFPGLRRNVVGDSKSLDILGNLSGISLTLPSNILRDYTGVS